MKKFILILLTVICAGTIGAQPPDNAARCKEEMKKLSYFIGDWNGEAMIRNAKGQLKVAQTEHIEWKMQGLILAIEGKGTMPNATGQEEVVFQAFAVVNFDPVESQFKFKSFVKEGYSTNAYFTILSENKYEWGFDIPAGGKSKYTIVLDPIKKTWHETGEYSRDGSTWMKTIELNLTKS